MEPTKWQQPMEVLNRVAKVSELLHHLMKPLQPESLAICEAEDPAMDPTPRSCNLWELGGRKGLAALDFKIFSEKP